MCFQVLATKNLLVTLISMLMEEQTNQAAPKPSFLVRFLRSVLMNDQIKIYTFHVVKILILTCWTGGSYFKCDHQKAVFLFLDTVNRTCSTRAYPCSSYKDFLAGKCLNCDRFRDAGCPLFGWWQKLALFIFRNRFFYLSLMILSSDRKKHSKKKHNYSSVMIELQSIARSLFY